MLDLDQFVVPILDELNSACVDICEVEDGNYIVTDKTTIYYNVFLSRDGKPVEDFENYVDTQDDETVINIQCHLHLDVDDTIGPPANLWQITPDFLSLFDTLPRISWMMEKVQAVTITGPINNKPVVVYLDSRETANELLNVHPELLGE